MKLSTERLFLRPWHEEDASDLYACASDPRIGEAADWPPHRSVEESRTVIREIFSAPETYAVVLRETGRVVGCIGLLRDDAGHIALQADEAEVGYWIGVPYWGRGLIPEALRALVAHAFGTLRLARLWCCSFAENRQSQRVQEKCGFRYVRTESEASGRTIRISRLDNEPRLTLRRADEQDIDLLRTLADEAFTATYRELLSPEQLAYMLERMYAPETLRREMRAGFEWFIAETDGTPCGYMSVERQEERLFHLQKIYVLPRFQGCGIGAFLFRCAVDRIRSLRPGHCVMELNVNRRNRAVGFYERMGMCRLREGDFPIGDGYFMNDYIMGLEW